MIRVWNRVVWRCRQVPGLVVVLNTGDSGGGAGGGGGGAGCSCGDGCVGGWSG